MPPRCKSSHIFSVIGIAYIQNVLSEFNSFLVALIVENKILQVHIDKKMKNLNLILPHKFLNTHIDNCILRTVWDYRKSLSEVATEVDNLTTKGDVLGDVTKIRERAIDGCKVMLTLYRGLVSEN